MTWQTPYHPTDVFSVIDGVLEAEQEAIDLDRELIDVADEAGDPVTRDITIGIRRDDASHLTLFERLRLADEV